MLQRLPRFHLEQCRDDGPLLVRWRKEPTAERFGEGEDPPRFGVPLPVDVGALDSLELHEGMRATFAHKVTLGFRRLGALRRCSERDVAALERVEHVVSSGELGGRDERVTKVCTGVDVVDVRN